MQRTAAPNSHFLLLKWPIHSRKTVLSAKSEIMPRAPTGAHGRISTIVVLKMDSESQFKTQLWIYKVQRVSSPKRDRPDGFRSTWKPIEKVEIYPSPTHTDLVLQFTLQDLFPGYNENDRESLIRIDLTSAIAEMGNIINSHRRGELIDESPSSRPNTPDASETDTAESDSSLEFGSQSSNQGSKYRPSTSASLEGIEEKHTRSKGSSDNTRD